MSAAPQRPKPWETSPSSSSTQVLTQYPSSSSASSVTNTAASAAAATTPSNNNNDNPPTLPARPTSLNSQPGLTNYTPYGSTAPPPIAMSGYGGGGGYGSSYGTGYGGYGGSYSSPYSRYGGGYGGGYGGSAGVGIPFGGDPNSMSRNFESSTQATFQLIESIVGAVGGFAQMLESTYMATHSSFFAMMSVAQQLGNLRTSLGSLFGIFTILRWIKKVISKLTGKKFANTSSVASQLTREKFAEFEANGGIVNNNRQRPSFKPLIMFLAAIFGLPYLMGKLIKALAEKQNQEMSTGDNNNNSSLDLSKLEFYRSIYDFNPENPQIELRLKKGDIIAILTKTDPLGNQSNWWRARSRDGNSGYVPSTYLEQIVRKSQPQPQQQVEKKIPSRPITPMGPLPVVPQSPGSDKMQDRKLAIS